MDINRIIRKYNIEDVPLLNKIESIFLKKRGYVFRIPQKSEPVIALMSGGLDTAVVISMLLAKYKLEVYPLHVNRKLFHSQKAEKSVDEVSKVFLKQYTKQFHKPFKVDFPIPPVELTLPVSIINDQLIFSSIFGKGPKFAQNRTIDKQGHLQGTPFQPSMYASLSMYYSQWLYETKGIKIRTIIGACLPNNARYFQYETLTAHRIVMLNLCSQNNDFSWQYTSLPIEKELGFYFEKDKIIQYGKKYRTPMEKTWTCWLNYKYQCGVCYLCSERRNAFYNAKVKDNSTYLNSVYKCVILKISIGRGIIGKYRYAAKLELKVKNDVVPIYLTKRDLSQITIETSSSGRIKPCRIEDLHIGDQIMIKKLIDLQSKDPKGEIVNIQIAKLDDQSK